MEEQEGFQGLKGDRNATERSTESTKSPGLLGISEIEPLAKNHTCAGPSSPATTYVADVKLGLHVGPEQLEQGLSQKLFVVCL